MATPKKAEAPQKSALPPADNLARIAAAAQTIANASDALLRAGSSKLTLADWALLQLLAGQDEAQPMARIAIQAGVTRQRIQKQLDALAEAKYVSLITPDEDKRLRKVSLTQAGREALRQTSAAWAAKLSGNEPLGALQNLDNLGLRVTRVANLMCRAARDEAVAAQGAAKRR
jgi:DNA-binding MarR family transcriptional regulator